MIPLSTALRALLASGQYVKCDLYTFALINGVMLRYANWPITVRVGGNTFLSGRVSFIRDKWKSAKGLDTASLAITLSVDPNNEPAINGVPLRQAIRAGFFQAATFEMDVAYFNPFSSVSVPVGTIASRVSGFVGTADAERLGAKITVYDLRKLLDMQVPWRLYSAQCRWNLGSTDCGVNLPSFAVTGAAGAGATTGVIPVSLAIPANMPTTYFTLGQVTFTSGANKGITRQVKAYVGGILSMATPFPFSPANGDTFSAVPGCDRTMPAFAASITAPSGGGSVVVASGASDYQDLGVVYASGASAGQALALVPSNPLTGQYAVVGNTYYFSSGDGGAGLIVSYVAAGGNPTGTCVKIFNNLSRFGGMPFIPPPEVAY